MKPTCPLGRAFGDSRFNCFCPFCILGWLLFLLLLALTPFYMLYVLINAALHGRQAEPGRERENESA